MKRERDEESHSDILLALQSVKDKLVAAIKSGDRDTARLLAAKLEGLKKQAESEVHKQAQVIQEKQAKEEADECLDDVPDMPYDELIQGIEQDRDRIEAEKHRQERLEEQSEEGVMEEEDGKRSAWPGAHGLEKCERPDCDVCQEDGCLPLEIESVECHSAALLLSFFLLFFVCGHTS